MINDFFDCTNVRSKTEYVSKRNHLLKRSTSQDDERFSWLKDVLLEYLNDWKDSTTAREVNYSSNDRENMFISTQTYEGFKISVYSHIEAIKFLLAQGFQYVLMERFMQDVLEDYFWHQKAKGGWLACVAGGSRVHKGGKLDIMPAQKLSILSSAHQVHSSARTNAFALENQSQCELLIMILAGLQCSKRCQFNNCFVFFCHGEQSNFHKTFAKAYTVNIMLFPNPVCKIAITSLLNNKCWIDILCSHFKTMGRLIADK